MRFSEQQRVKDALAYHMKGDLLRARCLYEQVLRENPAEFNALQLLGTLASQSGDQERAVALIDRAIAIEPNHATLYMNRGVALQALGQWHRALESFVAAAQLAPQDADAHFKCAEMLRTQKRWQEALMSYQRTIALRPGYAPAHFGLGNVQQQLGDCSSALASFDRALAIQPENAEAEINRGAILRDIDRLDEALSSYERAVALRPGWAEAHYNRANVLYELREIEQSLSSYSRALELKPDYMEAVFNRSLALLLCGDYERGWHDYESRWRSALARERREFVQPQWQGQSDIAGRTILLHAEQGLGDALQFCRYAPRVAALGATVVLEIYEPLVALVTRLEGVSAVVHRGDLLPSFNLHCPLMSLPAAFGTTLSTIPAGVPYLSCDPALRRLWSERLGEPRGLRVGLVWSGGFRPEQPEVWAVNARRNIPLERLRPLRVTGIEFFSLQKGAQAEAELTLLAGRGWDGPPIREYGSLIRDFADTAAFISQLDLVITVDTSTLHLAGALGKPVWLLDRFDHCWRWLRDRDDSPWYPTLRIYRQPRAGAWDDVVARVAGDLAAMREL